MDLKTFTAQIELMHQEALRQSVSYEDKWLNTFHGGRESARSSTQITERRMSGWIRKRQCSELSN